MRATDVEAWRERAPGSVREVHLHRHRALTGAMAMDESLVLHDFETKLPLGVCAYGGNAMPKTACRVLPTFMNFSITIDAASLHMNSDIDQ